MKINFPKIIRPLPLSEYAAELTPVLQVWVNPPRDFLDSFGNISEIIKLKKGEKSIPKERLAEFNGLVYAWVSELLSQGEDPDSKMTADDLRLMVDETTPTDPQFWGWLQGRVIQMIKEHRTQTKNA